MKIKIHRSRINDALRRISSGANAKTDIPVLANVKMVAENGVVAMTTTNAFITLYTEVPCEVIESGATTIPIRMLSSIVSAMMDGDVEIEQKGNKARIVCGNFVTQVGTIPVDQFPPVQKIDSECKFVVPVSNVRNLLRKTSYAQCVDDTRRILNGVLFEFGEDKLRCVATDGRRVAVAETEGKFGSDEKHTYIIPSSTVANLTKFLSDDGDVEIIASKSHVRFVMDSGANVVMSRLVDGVFPNYMAVIPTGNNKIVEVERSELIGAVERVSVMAVRSDSCVKMTITDNRMLVEVKGDDLCDAHDEIPVKYTGEKVEIIFNPRYVLDYFKASDSDVVKMEFDTGLSPANFKSVSERYVGTLMPLRVANI